MVGTLKKCVGRLVADRKIEWEGEVSQAIYGYRRRPLQFGHSPFELMYGVPPRLVTSDPVIDNDTTEEGRRLENLAYIATRAARFENQVVPSAI